MVKEMALVIQLEILRYV